MSSYILLYAAVMLTGVSGLILNHLPELLVFRILVFGGLAVVCVMIVQFAYKFQTTVEFDETNVYIARFGSKNVQTIPLADLIKLESRQVALKDGAYWYRRYVLIFSGDSGQRERVRFLIYVGPSNLNSFVSAVKAVNPYFESGF